MKRILLFIIGLLIIACSSLWIIGHNYYKSKKDDTVKTQEKAAIKYVLCHEYSYHFVIDENNVAKGFFYDDVFNYHTSSASGEANSAQYIPPQYYQFKLSTKIISKLTNLYNNFDNTAIKTKVFDEVKENAENNAYIKINQEFLYGNTNNKQEFSKQVDNIVTAIISDNEPINQNKIELFHVYKQHYGDFIIYSDFSTSGTFYQSNTSPTCQINCVTTPCVNTDYESCPQTPILMTSQNLSFSTIKDLFEVFLNDKYLTATVNEDNKAYISNGYYTIYNQNFDELIIETINKIQRAGIPS